MKTVLAELPGALAVITQSKAVGVILYLTNPWRSALECPAVMLPRTDAAHQLGFPQDQPPTEGLSPVLPHLVQPQPCGA